MSHDVTDYLKCQMTQRRMLHHMDDELAGVSIKLNPAQASLSSKIDGTQKRMVDKKGE